MKSILLIIVLSVTFYSCDYPAYSRKVVQNKSKYDLLLVVYHNSSFPTDTFKIGSHTDAIIKKIDGGPTGPGPLYSKGNCTADNDSLSFSVINNSALKITKDLNSDDAWTFSQSGGAWKGVTVKCISNITDADIVPK
jgi:hypothetical protein